MKCLHFHPNLVRVEEVLQIRWALSELNTFFVFSFHLINQAEAFFPRLNSQHPKLL